MSYGHRERKRPKNTGQGDFGKEMWTAGYNLQVQLERKMEAAAQNRAGMWSVPPIGSDIKGRGSIVQG